MQGYDDPTAASIPKLSPLAWANDASYIAGPMCAGSSGKTCAMYTWDVVQRKRSQPFEGKIGAPWIVSVSPDGAYILADNGRDLMLWDAGTGKLADTLKGHI